MSSPWKIVPVCVEGMGTNTGARQGACRPHPIAIQCLAPVSGGHGAGSRAKAVSGSPDARTKDAAWSRHHVRTTGHPALWRCSRSSLRALPGRSFPACWLWRHHHVVPPQPRWPGSAARPLAAVGAGRADLLVPGSQDGVCRAAASLSIFAGMAGSRAPQKPSPRGRVRRKVCPPKQSGACKAPGRHPGEPGCRFSGAAGQGARCRTGSVRQGHLLEGHRGHMLVQGLQRRAGLAGRTVLVEGQRLVAIA